MPFTCAVAECKNSRKVKAQRGGSLLFHRFPNNPEYSKVWLVKCKRKDNVKMKTARMCSDHFLESDYQRDLKNELLNLPTRRILKPDSVPTIFEFRNKTSVILSERQKRRTKRDLKEEISSLLSLSAALPDENNVSDQLEDSVSTYEIPGSFEFSSSDCEQDMSTNKNVELQLLKGRVNELESIVSKQRVEIIRLRSQLRSEKSKYSTLKDTYTSNLRKVFSLSQSKKLMGQKRVNYSSDDIIAAMSIRNVSLKAYENAKKVLQVPLHSVRTLSKWTSKFICEEGLLEELLQCMEEEVKAMDTMDVLAVLSFDEMSLDSSNFIDPTLQKIVSHSKVQVAMLRGLCRSWKQPIYYGFSQNITSSLLNNIIMRVETAGFKVCAIVCDLRGENRSLLKSLNVSVSSVSIQNPVDESRRIFLFADVPHCLKNIRNHLLDDGVVLEDGTKIDKVVLFNMIKSNGSEMKLCPNLSPDSLEINGAHRMRVRPAAQLLSHRTATLAYKCFPQNRSIGDFFETVNNGFDVLNSRIPY